MAYPANKERNRQLVELRIKDPDVYTFGKLGEIFKIKDVTAYKIYKREVGRNDPVLAH